MTVVQVPQVSGDRIALRGFEIGDFDAYAAFYGSDRARFVGGPMDRRKAWAEFAVDTVGWQLRGYGMWAVDLQDSGELIGWAGVIQPEYYDEPELGWMLRDGYEGQGLAFEAAETARSFARSTLGLDGLASFIAEGNDRSIRLAERLGAVWEADGKMGTTAFHRYRHPKQENT